MCFSGLYLKTHAEICCVSKIENHDRMVPYFVILATYVLYKIEKKVFSRTFLGQ